MNRQKVIDKKASEIQKELEQWAKKHKVLSPGEQILFKISITNRPLAMRAQDEPFLDMQDMKIVNFFTNERCSAVGIDERLRGRIISIPRHRRLQIELGEVPHSTKPIETLRDLISEGKRELMYIHSIGAGIIDAANKVMEKVGLSIPENSSR